MPWKNSETRYSSVSIALHWLMLVLLILVYACIELRGFFPKGSGGRALITEAHFMLGLTVFVLVWLRLFARSLGAAPKVVPSPSLEMQLLASALHWVLYGFMIIMPILGWLAVSAKGNSVLFYGIELPPLIAPNHPLVKSLEAIHSLLGTVGYFLIGIHAVAGLYHHYVVRDNTLLRIWPKRG